MASLRIVKIGHPVLREKCQRVEAARLVDAKFRQFLKEMVQTMHRSEGVGLAANQVGEGIQVIVLECNLSERYPEAEPVPLQTYLNPRIVEYSEAVEEDWEGCLSIPGYRGMVPRSKAVTFEALNEKGELVRRRVTDFQARVIQHEVDHINGLFYMDRMPDLQAWCHLEEFNRRLGLKVRD